MALYAQYGYGKANKINKGIENGDISGVILSPKAENPEKLVEFANGIRDSYPGTNVFFDPQFFLGYLNGEINGGKIINYSYFESGLTRARLSNPINVNSFVISTISFQDDLNVSSYISPSIIISDFNSMDCQIAISLAYSTIQNAVDKNLYIALYINENAFSNESAMDEFLNIISLFDVTGFYVVISRNSGTAKSTLFDSNILSNIMKFLYIISEINQFEVIVGYSDIISVLFSAVSNANFACGWYSNLKQFSESNYRPSSGGRRPRKRYTSSKLLSPLLLLPEIEVLNRNGFTNNILSGTTYDGIICPNMNDTNWTDEISCLHNWRSINTVLTDISQIQTISNRLDYVLEKISEANSFYSQIETYLPQLDEKSNNNHLDVWDSAIVSFRGKMGV